MKKLVPKLKIKVAMILKSWMQFIKLEIKSGIVLSFETTVLRIGFKTKYLVERHRANQQRNVWFDETELVNGLEEDDLL